METSIYPSIDPSLFHFIDLYTSIYIYLSIYLYIYIYLHLSVYLYLSTFLSIYTYLFLSLPDSSRWVGGGWSEGRARGRRTSSRHHTDDGIPPLALKVKTGEEENKERREERRGEERRGDERREEKRKVERCRDRGIEG